EEGWVALLGKRLAQRKPACKVMNASVSGETTAGGVSRIAKVLERHDPDVVVIELGANDGLRGLPLAASRANLERMVRAARDSGAEVLLVGMRMPPNLGRAYTEGFEANFREVAKDDGVGRLPFLLEPIGSDADAFQADDLHPTAAVQPRLLEHVWTALGPLLWPSGLARARAGPRPRWCLGGRWRMYGTAVSRIRSSHEQVASPEREWRTGRVRQARHQPRRDRRRGRAG